MSQDVIAFDAAAAMLPCTPNTMQFSSRELYSLWLRTLCVSAEAQQQQQFISASTCSTFAILLQLYNCCMCMHSARCIYHSSSSISSSSSSSMSVPALSASASAADLAATSASTCRTFFMASCASLMWKVLPCSCSCSFAAFSYMCKTVTALIILIIVVFFNASQLMMS